MRACIPGEGVCVLKIRVPFLPRTLVGVAAAAMALASANAASAQTTVYYGSSATLTIPVTATVGGRCGFADGAAPSGSQDVGQLDTTTWQYDFPFTLECTGPSRIAIVSGNGGLKNGTGSAPTGYSNRAPYTVAVHVVHSAGTTDGNCVAASLEASSAESCALRGTASATVGMAVPAPSFDLNGSYVRVSAPAYSGSDVLVSGTYSDTLTVTVSPAS